MRLLRSALSLWLRKEPRSAVQYWKVRLAIAMRRPDEASSGLKEAEALGYDLRQLRVLRSISSVLAAPCPQAEPLGARSSKSGVNPTRYSMKPLPSSTWKAMTDSAEDALKRWMNDAPDAAKPYLWQAQIDSRRGQR